MVTQGTDIIDEDTWDLAAEQAEQEALWREQDGWDKNR